MENSGKLETLLCIITSFSVGVVGMLCALDWEKQWLPFVIVISIISIITLLSVFILLFKILRSDSIPPATKTEIKKEVAKELEKVV